METILNIIIIILCIFIAILLIYLVRLERKNRKLRLKSNQVSQENKELQKIIKDLEFKETLSNKENLYTKNLITTLRLTISLLINPSSYTLVYTLSNFYKNFNFYNKRYYAKVNNKSTNNKAEAIPFLQVNGKNNLVLDLYKLKALYSTGALNIDTNILETFKSCYVTKEEVITNLSNKDLKSYKG